MSPELAAEIFGQNGTGSTHEAQHAKVKERGCVSPFVTRSKRTTTTPTQNPDTVRRTAKNVLPEEDDEQQSVTLSGFLFKRDGVGWECRHTIYLEPRTIGEKRERKRPYLAHLSRTNYEQMKARSKNIDELQANLVKWAEQKKTEKSEAPTNPVRLL